MSYLLFLSFLAYLHRRAVTSPSASATSLPTLTPRGLSRRWLWPIGLFTSVVMVVLVYMWNIRPINASRLLIHAFQAPSVEQGLEFFEKALAANTFGNPEIKIQLGVLTINQLGNEGLDVTVKQKLFEAANRQINAEIKKSPGHAVYPLYLGILLRRVGQNEAALPYLELARQFSPTKQIILFELVSLYFDLGEKEKALELAQQAYESTPAFGDAIGVYADALVRHNRVEEAKDLLEKISRPDTRLINAFVEVQEYEIVLSLWQKLVDQSPENVQYRFSLAATYLQLGQRQQAIRTLEEAIQVDPRVAEQARSLINEIKAGRNPIQRGS